MVKRLRPPNASAEAQRALQWIWQQRAWPNFTWDDAKLAAPLASARLRQGELLGGARLLDAGLSREAQAQILIQDGINTSAIEGEQINIDAILQEPGFPPSARPFVVSLDAAPTHAVAEALRTIASLDFHVVPPFAMPILREGAPESRCE